MTGRALVQVRPDLSRLFSRPFRTHGSKELCSLADLCRVHAHGGWAASPSPPFFPDWGRSSSSPALVRWTNVSHSFRPPLSTGKRAYLSSTECRVRLAHGFLSVPAPGFRLAALPDSRRCVAVVPPALSSRRGFRRSRQPTLFRFDPVRLPARRRPVSAHFATGTQGDPPLSRSQSTNQTTPRSHTCTHSPSNTGCLPLVSTKPSGPEARLPTKKMGVVLLCTSTHD